MCQWSECHTGALTNLSITFLPQNRLTIHMMDSIVITTGVSLTHTKEFCNFLEGMCGIFLLITINHLTPELCLLGAINAVLGMNFNLSHGGVGG